MRIREVSERQLLAVLRNPSETGLPTEPGREHVRKYKNVRQSIDAVYKLWHDRVVVITVYPTKQSKRN